MPILNIAGQRITVDDSFLSLSPEAQTATVDEIVSSLGIEGAPPPAAAVASAPESPVGASEEAGSGLALNTTAGVNEGIYSVLGAPVDLTRGAMNLGIRGLNAATGSEIDLIPENSFGGSRYIAESLGAVHPVLDPENTKAASTEERIARGVGQGVGYTLAPEAALATATRAGMVAPRIGETAGRIFGRGESVGAASTNAVIGGVSGGGSSAAMEASPDEYDALSSMAGGLAAGGVGALVAGIPTAVRTGASLAGDYFAPLTDAGRQRLAAERFRESATDVQAVRDMLDNMPAELVPGSVPTTGQLTGDRGLLAAERGSAVKRSDLYAGRREEQKLRSTGGAGGRAGRWCP